MAPHTGGYAATQRKGLLGPASPCVAPEDTLLSGASQALNDQYPLTPRRAAPRVRIRGQLQGERQLGKAKVPRWTELMAAQHHGCG